MWTLLHQHCRLTGDSTADVRARIEAGTWQEDVHVRTHENGSLEVNTVAFNAWVESDAPMAPPPREASPALAAVAASLRSRKSRPPPNRSHRVGRERVTTNLYRHYGEDGSLLYVGISLSAVQRLSQHMRSSSWERLIDRIEIERFASRAAALAAEAEAIRTERPLFNVQHATGEMPERSRANRGANPVRNERQSMPISGLDELQSGSAGSPS